jgi:prophage regulatory protein
MQNGLVKPERILGHREMFGDGKKVPFRKSCAYAMIGRGEFPSPVQLSPGRVGWRESDIDAWIASRPIVDPRRPAAKRAGARSGAA